MIALPFRRAVDSLSRFPPPGKSTKIHPGVPDVHFLWKHHQGSHASVQSRPHVHCSKGTVIQRQVDRGKRLGQWYFQGELWYYEWRSSHFQGDRKGRPYHIRIAMLWCMVGATLAVALPHPIAPVSMTPDA